MFEYVVEDAWHVGNRNEAVQISVALSPLHHGATHHKPLAVALLGVLNDHRFRARPYNDAFGSDIAVRFSDPNSEESVNIIASFYLPRVNDEVIQLLANQCQRFLAETMTVAVDTFKMVQAVGTIDTYRGRVTSAVR